MSRSRAIVLVGIGLVLGALCGTLPRVVGYGAAAGGGGITPNAYISGLRIQVTGDSTISVTSGVAMDRGNTVLFSSAATITTTTPFAAWADGNDFGLDTGAEGASTWYHLHWIRDSTASEGVLLSTSKTAPSMPAGATLRRWIGAVRNDASGNLLQCEYVGAGPERSCYYRAETVTGATEFRVLSGGAAGALTNVSCAGVAAPSSASVELDMSSSGTAGGVVFANGQDGVDTYYPSNLLYQANHETVMVDESQIMQYRRSGGATVTINVTGYTISLDGSD